MFYEKTVEELEKLFTESGLNPCSNGICSMSCLKQKTLQIQCLNPCSNGICSMRQLKIYNYDLFL